MFSSFTFGHVLGLKNLHVPIVYILGNVLGLDECHLPICYQNPPFSVENACTKSGISVVPLVEMVELLIAFVGFCVDFPF